MSEEAAPPPTDFAVSSDSGRGVITISVLTGAVSIDIEIGPDDAAMLRDMLGDVLGDERHQTESRETEGRNPDEPTRGYYQWTGPELELIQRTDVSARTLAKMLGRSHGAVRTMRWRTSREPALDHIAGVALPADVRVIREVLG